MRKIAAQYIFPISSKPIKQGIIELSDEGEILNIFTFDGGFKETALTEFYNGILVPGFVNIPHDKNLKNIISPTDKFINLEITLKDNPYLVIKLEHYATNENLSIIKNLLTIQQLNPNIPFETLLKCVTLNAAKVLHLEKNMGSFEIGKKPGINLITELDLENMRLTAKSNLKILI